MAAQCRIRASRVNLGCALFLATVLTAAACSAAPKSVTPSTTSLPTVHLGMLQTSSAVKLAQQLQTALSSLRWTHSFEMEGRGINRGTVKTAANLTLNDAGAQRILMRDGYIGSATSMFAVATSRQVVEGALGVSLFQFATPKGAIDFANTWLRSKMLHQLDGISNSYIESSMSAACGKQSQGCLGAVGFAKTGLIIVVGVQCNGDCQPLGESVGVSLYRSLE